MSKEAGSGGVGFCGLLTLLFIALKLTHQIDWSWIWVLSPLWISAVLVIGIVFAVFAVFVFGFIINLFK